MTTQSSTATIVLCGGSIRLTALPIATASSNAMLPINGRPVVAWILDDLASKGVDRVTVVLRAGDDALRALLGRVYAQRMQIDLAEVPDSGGSIVRSLHAGLAANPEATAVRVVLGDTLIEDDFDRHPDFVYLGKTGEPDRWCVASLDSDSWITGYSDKQDLPGREHLALAGYYRFDDAAWLSRCTAMAFEHGSRELSAVLREYGKHHPLRGELVQTWFDFGNVDNYARAKLHLLRPRFFNSVSIDPVLHTLTKRSTKVDKLLDEVAWFQALPKHLEVISPRLLGWGQSANEAWYTQEYYGYPPLSDLYVWGELDLDVWLSILRRVLAVHEALSAVPGALPPEAMRSMYWTKTLERIEAARSGDPELADVLEPDTLTYNGQLLTNLAGLLPALQAAVEGLVASAKPALVHGDLCFSNILFDIPNQIVRLIDPRGSFGQPGPVGDPRYDLAKLRHSVCGGYDLLMANYFEVAYLGPATYEVRQWRPVAAGRLAAPFDALLSAAGHSVQDITLLEGLLFLSMPPLHRGHPDRQRAMYLYGLSLLNQVLGSPPAAPKS